MADKKLVEQFKKTAKELRKDILEMTTEAGSGHPTSSLSCIDILAVLYFHEMKFNPKKPDWPERDRFLMSKGHGVPAQYACLAKAGFFPKSELKTLRKLNSRLQGHPDREKTPGIEISSGSLGQGLSVGNGIALAGKLDKKNYRRRKHLARNYSKPDFSTYSSFHWRINSQYHALRFASFGYKINRNYQ